MFPLMTVHAFKRDGEINLNDAGGLGHRVNLPQTVTQEHAIRGWKATKTNVLTLLGG